ncbi:hypothetical protein ABZ848_37400 [Streptomyces sp. NPDC047081]|uniref:hypothetical protein n=1 Tax=Streptomyces sp. NPDC047081 TaxID=3154706 RepID=UPI0033F7E1B4
MAVVRRYRRGVGVALLLVGVLAGPVMTHVGWVRVVERIYRDSIADDGTDGGGTQDVGDGRTDSRTAKKYRAGNRERVGSTAVRVVPDSGTGAAWRATALHRLRLAPGDPMVGDLRSDRQELADWLPFELMLSGDGKNCPSMTGDTSQDDDRLEQTGPRSSVYAFDVSRDDWVGGGPGCSSTSTYIYAATKDGLLGKHGIYDRWTLTVDSPRRPVLSVEGGTVLSETAHHVELRLPAKGYVAVKLGVSAAARVQPRGDLVVLADAAQGSHWPIREAAALLLAVLAVTSCWAVPLVRGWAPAATRGRWTAAAVMCGALTAATLGYALAAIVDERSQPWWQYAGMGMPLVAWWWVLLPFLLGAFVIRAGTGRPPRLRQLLPLALVPGVVPLLLVPVLAVVGGTAAPLLPVAVGGLAAALLGYALRRGVLGTAGRRWAATAAAGLWLVAVSLGPGTGWPDDGYGTSGWTVADDVVAMALSWGWPALLWPVLTALGRPVRNTAALVLTVWVGLPVLTELDQWTYAWTLQTEDVWSMTGVFPFIAANRPLVAMQTVVICGALLFLAHEGRAAGAWPAQVRAVASGLGIAAVATAVTQLGFVGFYDDDAQRAGGYLAVAMAAAGFALLFPPGAETRAARLHAVRPRAHNRRMHALLKDQTLAASRREFLTASRTALAAGELTAPEWSARWRSLGALGARGTAPQHSAALRLAALGSSGGRDAWRNGVAAAVLLTGLSLPWLVYTLPARLSHVSTVDYGVAVWTYALRWPLYGFVYGYAYSWLRGGSPLGKAMCLLAVVLPAELAELFYRGLKPGDFGILLLLTTGDCLAVFLVLGLYWEARLVRAAGLRWGQIRNFRSLSAAAVPATTVLVAAATALATAMVGVWVSPTAAPATENRQEQPTATATPTLGP